MKTVFRKILLAVLGGVMALGSALASIDGGSALTLSDIGSIPLVSWLFAVGASITGYLGNTQATKKSG